MGTNGDQHPPRPRIEIAQAAASPEEAAAIAAALEQFLRDTTPAPAPRPRIEIAQSAASPEEAAAIAAALEQFLRDTAPAPVAADTAVNPWLRAGLYENAGLDPTARRHGATTCAWGRKSYPDRHGE